MLMRKECITSHCLMRILGWLGHTFSKMTPGNAVTVNGEHYHNTMMVCFGRYGFRRDVVSAGWGDLSHCSRHNAVVA